MVARIEIDADPPTGPDQPATEPDITPMPEGGEAKYYDEEKGSYDWESAFKESKFNADGRKVEDPPAASGDPLPTVGDGEPGGIDYGKYTEELQDNDGKLSDESYTELAEKHNLTKDAVDTYIRGVQAGSADLREAGLEVTDGEDGFTAMSSWAVENASEEELNAYNQGVGSSDASEVKAAVQIMFNRYAEAEGIAPKYTDGGDGGGGDSDRYASWQEVMRDMKTGTLYGLGDPAEVARVQAKLGRSELSQ